MDYNMIPPMPGGMAGGGQQGNPWFNIANQFTPRTLHEVIKWARYITTQSPTTTEVIRKLATYPITKFDINTSDEEQKTKYEEILDSLKLKEFLQDAGFEFFTIGNVFISIYFPIHRDLVCPGCNTRYNVKKASWASIKRYEYVGKCPNDYCGHNGIFKRVDTKSTNIEDINIIKWTPEHILVNHNPITGEKEYYYKIPNRLKQSIAKGDRLSVDSVPWEFVIAAKNNQDFKFEKGHLFHLQNISSGGTVEGIAVPPLLSLFTLVFYQATLRRANEAIATEYLNPMRVIYPQAGNGAADPAIAASLKNFRGNIEEAIRIHKRDKNFFLVAPVPVGYQAVGGEGRNLLVSQEIQQAEEQILLSLGVSRELLSGVTNWQSTSVGLRMMENTLYSYTSRLEDLITWVIKRISAYLNIPNIPTKLVPFTLVDDDTTKNLLTQLAQAGKISMGTVFEEFGLNFKEEQDKIKKEAVANSAMQIEIQFESEQAQFLAAKKASDTFKDNEEFTTALDKANATAEQLYSAEEGVRRSFLAQLKTVDYAQWLMVSKIIEEIKQSADHQAQVAQGVDQAAVATDAGGAGSGAAQNPNQPQPQQQGNQ